MNGETILVVDDNKEIVYSISELLKYEGYQVVKAYDGMEALKALETNQIDLILLDVMMPRKNGYEVCQEIRADQSLAATRILMLTAKGRETEVTKGLAVGADAYMTKPFSTRDLVARVRSLLEVTA